MINNIINKVRKQIIKNSDILILLGFILLLIIICIFFKACSDGNNDKNDKSIIINNLDNKTELSESFKDNDSNHSKLDTLQQIKKSIGTIDKVLFNLEHEIINNVEQEVVPSINTSVNTSINQQVKQSINKQVKPSINKNVNSNNFEFINISGIESFSGLPFMNQSINLSSKPLELNLKEKMPVDMQLKRMKVVLQELKRRIENGEQNTNIHTKTNNVKNKNVETFNDMDANQILKEISNLLQNISNRPDIVKDVSQEEYSNYTIEEEIIIENNQEDRKSDDGLTENVFIESVESEGIDDIYHPRLQII